MVGIETTGGPFGMVSGNLTELQGIQAIHGNNRRNSDVINAFTRIRLDRRRQAINQITRLHNLTAGVSLFRRATKRSMWK